MSAEPYLLFALFAVVFGALEWLRPHKSRPRFSIRRYRTDLLHAFVGGFLIRAGTTAVLVLILDRTGRGTLAVELPLVIQVVVIFVLADLAFWLAHRACHAVPFLWRFHKIHHSSAHLDWLASYRVHPVDQILNSTVIALPTLLIGFSPTAVLIHAFIFEWHSTLLHSNLRVSFGALGKVFATTQFHHWHHAEEVEAHDRNFGGQLTIWDRLFGTWIDPPGFPVRYGVADAPGEGFLSHMAAPLLPTRSATPARDSGSDLEGMFNPVLERVKGIEPSS
jgi:sterol desaturase/sphingolipid hydroxylase (fatty acid hydroxylase superfamily)